MKKVIDIIKKLAKAPAFLWVLVMALSYYFANIYTLNVNMENSILMANEMMESMGVSYPINTMQFKITGYLFSSLLIVGIFELFIYFIFRSFVVRRQLFPDKTTFKMTARLSFILANIVIGLFSLLYFAVPQMHLYGRLLFNFAAYTAAYALAYQVVADEMIHPRFIAQAYMRLYSIYFIFSGVESLFSLMLSITDKVDILAYALKFSLVIIVSVVLYFVQYKKLLKREKDFINSPPTPPADDNPQDQEIFKGFGF